MTDLWIFRPVQPREVRRQLFSAFDRKQPVNLCWRREETGGWVLRPDPFLDDWSEEDYGQLVVQLQATLQNGGLVEGAFLGETGPLKGFASVDAQPYGRAGDYRDLTNLHVSRECRGQGLGRRLFRDACAWARAQGAKKLYLSAHSAAETMAFYHSMGCVEAAEPSQAHMEAEPFDCQLEYRLAD